MNKETLSSLTRMLSDMLKGEGDLTALAHSLVLAEAERNAEAGKSQKQEPELQRFLQSNLFVVTGSTAYGLPNPKDLDLLCCPNIFKDLLVKLEAARVKYNPVMYCRGVASDNIRFKLLRKEYNVFSLPTVAERNSWIRTTRALRAMVISGFDLTDKVKRVKVFKLIYEDLK